MTQLVELTAAKHSALRVVPERVMKVISTRHMMNLRVGEVANSVSCFPVFMTRVEQSASWGLSAVCSLEAGNNLFARGDQWHAIYQPVSMQTFPFYLMKAKHTEKGYTIGVDEQSDVFSEQEGESLFEENQKATPYLSQIKSLLETSIKNDIQTSGFTQRLSDLSLIKTISVLVEYEDGTINTINGLSTVDEDKLQALSSAAFEDLRVKGYLAPIYAMLVSIFQLNSLLQRHNALQQGAPIKQIKLETAKR